MSRIGTSCWMAIMKVIHTCLSFYLSIYQSNIPYYNWSSLPTRSLQPPLPGPLSENMKRNMENSLEKKKRKRRNLKTSQIPTRCLRVKSDDSVWFFGDSLDKGFSAGFAIGREECVDLHRFTRAVCRRQGAGKKWGRAKANGASARPRLMDSKSFLKAVTALMRVRSCWS